MCLLLTLKTTFRFRKSLQTSTVIISNNYPRISSKIGFIIEEKPFLLELEFSYFIAFHNIISLIFCYTMCIELFSAQIREYVNKKKFEISIQGLYDTQKKSVFILSGSRTHTGCLIKNASTHNFFIYYPISMNKKIEDMVFHTLRSSHKNFFFWRYFQ
jgi:hypothetical protein